MRPIAYIALAAVAVGATTPWQSRADELFSLVIDPITGAAALRNDGPAAVDLDGYFVGSAAAPVLDSAAWSSLEDGAVSGWREFSTENRLGELNLFEALSVAPGQSVDIGNPYVPFAPAQIGETEPGFGLIDFTYSTTSEGTQLVGDVEFSSRNTVVLVVDPATGDAVLENQSAFDIAIDSYFVRSTPGVIDTASWTPLSSGDSAWAAATGAANRIAEGNLFGSTQLTAGGLLSLGQAIDPALLTDETDLELDFTLAGGGTVAGGVLFAVATPLGTSADFDSSGVVDGLDLGIWESGFGAAGSQGDGDATGDGFVAGGDFLAWQQQFSGAAGASVGAAAVPEPQTMAMALSACLALAAVGRRSLRGA